MPMLTVHATDDPGLLSVGRGFDVNWLFVFTDGRAEADTIVYEFFEHPGAPCYVGITGDFPMRWVTHRARSPWFPMAAINGVFIQGFKSRREARMVEAALIAEHKPRFNTKRETKYLQLARTSEEPEPEFMAEIIPNYRRNRPAIVQ